MPQFRYTGDDERVFPDSSVTVSPGEIVERDTNPHPAYFVEVDGSSPDVPVDPVIVDIPVVSDATPVEGE